MSTEKAPIVFDLETIPKPSSTLDLEREKHKKRAERFSTTYIEPTQRKDLLLETRREIFSREGFKTGIDLFTQEEQQKRKTRSNRFNFEDTLSYKPDVEVEVKTKRAQRFGTTYEPTEAALMDMDLYEARVDPAPDVARRPEAIHLYGVDVLSTADVLSYFEDYGPTFVEWVNDSSCNVVFADELTAKRALVGSGTPMPTPDAPSLPSTSGEAETLDALPYVWHRGRDMLKTGTTVSLVYRMATVEDVKKGERRTRELWKLGTPGGKRPRTFTRPSGGTAEGNVDADGDQKMKRPRGNRGGRKVRQQQVKGANGRVLEYEDFDIDMEDVEEDGEEEAAEEGEVHANVDGAAKEVEKEPAVESAPEDLRQLIKPPQPWGPTFSATLAGVVST